MTLPWHYKSPPAAPDDWDADEWENNWLSNSLAWASDTFLPSWCGTPDHWTSRFMDYLYSSCPCCLFFRGATIGVILGATIGLLAGLSI